MRLDMERLQQDFNESHKVQNPSDQDPSLKEDMIKDNQRMKMDILELQSRIKKLNMEKNRLVSLDSYNYRLT